MKIQDYISPLILGIGIAVAGAFVMSGLESMSNRDRLVSVRGFAEREVKADHVIWPITIEGTAETLKQVHANVSKTVEEVQEWLVKNGVKKENIQSASPEVNNRSLNYGFTPGKEPKYGYNLVITVSTDNVDVVKDLVLRTGELLVKGITVNTNQYTAQKTQYEFTKLADIKPQMIEEATKNARQAAEKFAKDSESEIGKIKSARQGLFTITNRDAFTPYIKSVRVVTTVDYFIED